MIYQLTPEEMTKVKDLIRLLTNAADGRSDERLHWGSIRDEKEAVQLAWSIERFIR